MRALRLALAAGLALGASGCTTAATGLVVVVEAEPFLSGPEGIQRLRIEVYNPPDASGPTQSVELNPAAWPASVSVLPRELNGAVRVEVIGLRMGMSGGRVLAISRRMVAFQEGRVLLVRVPLYDVCAGHAACADDDDCRVALVCADRNEVCVNGAEPDDPAQPACASAIVTNPPDYESIDDAPCGMNEYRFDRICRARPAMQGSP
ncbi:MAG: hypothetical protein R3A52_29585 [Polyangiales bacterium]